MHRSAEWNSSNGLRINMSGTYTVRRGDTLTSVARFNGCSVSELQHANQLADPNRLSVGQVLVLPLTRTAGEKAKPNPKAVPATHPPLPPITAEQTTWDEIAGCRFLKVSYWHDLLDPVLAPMREKEADSAVHEKDHAPAKPVTPATSLPTKTAPAPNHPTGSTSQRGNPRTAVLEALKKRLDLVPQQKQTSGVKLSRNERKFIIAGVGLCEGNKDVFGSTNADTEFAGRKFGKHGVEVKYSRIVHIGLSYGYIQCSQDSGNLGKLLTRFKAISNEDFLNTFGKQRSKAESTVITDKLIELTTNGINGVQHKSGQAAWNSYSSKKREDLKKLAGQDADHDGKPDLPESEIIRGARVQPIPYNIGGPADDLWGKNWMPRFQAAGDIIAFQDAQLDFGVDDFLNKILPICKKNNIRTGKGIAFVTACAVRSGNPEYHKLFVRIALELGYSLPFNKTADELTVLSAISKSATKTNQPKIGSITFDPIEVTRATTILKNEFKFLSEDFYDPETYDKANDNDNTI